MCNVIVGLNIRIIILTFELRNMATRVAAPGRLSCVDELERRLIDLSEQVELKKEELGLTSNSYMVCCQ